MKIFRSVTQFLAIPLLTAGSTTSVYLVDYGLLQYQKLSLTTRFWSQNQALFPFTCYYALPSDVTLTLSPLN